MKLKFDSCSLIEAQKLDIIPIITKLYGSIYITPQVYKESIEDNINLDITSKLNNHLNQQNIIKIKVNGILLSNLGRGEAETIAEVKNESENNEKAIFISEDKKALRIALKLKQRVLGLEMLLVEACFRNFLSEQEFKEKIYEFDSFHKLNLIRMSEIFEYVRLFKSKIKK
jgi:predicted nucleic acid-binding protein